jgi:hypothetical protein
LIVGLSAIDADAKTPAPKTALMVDIQYPLLSMSYNTTHYVTFQQNFYFFPDEGQVVGK